MKNIKSKIVDFEDYEDIRKEIFTPEEIKNLDASAAEEVAAIKSLQDSISAAVAKYMAAEGIGFNELTRRLDISSRITSKLVKGNSNLSMGTIAHLSTLLGKKPRIVFE
jgi:Cro/C1-type HTH DNA-binding domain